MLSISAANNLNALALAAMNSQQMGAQCPQSPPLASPAPLQPPSSGFTNAQNSLPYFQANGFTLNNCQPQFVNAPPYLIAASTLPGGGYTFQNLNYPQMGGLGIGMGLNMGGIPGASGNMLQVASSSVQNTPMLPNQSSAQNTLQSPGYVAFIQQQAAAAAAAAAANAR